MCHKYVPAIFFSKKGVLSRPLHKVELHKRLLHMQLGLLFCCDLAGGRWLPEGSFSFEQFNTRCFLSLGNKGRGKRRKLLNF